MRKEYMSILFALKQNPVISSQSRMQHSCLIFWVPEELWKTARSPWRMWEWEGSFPDFFVGLWFGTDSRQFGKTLRGWKGQRKFILHLWPLSSIVLNTRCCLSIPVDSGIQSEQERSFVQCKARGNETNPWWWLSHPIPLKPTREVLSKVFIFLMLLLWGRNVKIWPRAVCGRVLNCFLIP